MCPLCKSMHMHGPFSFAAKVHTLHTTSLTLCKHMLLYAQYHARRTSLFFEYGRASAHASVHTIGRCSCRSPAQCLQAYITYKANTRRPAGTDQLAPCPRARCCVPLLAPQVYARSQGRPCLSRSSALEAPEAHGSEDCLARGRRRFTSEAQIWCPMLCPLAFQRVPPSPHAVMFNEYIHCSGCSVAA
jgi:hypothetical protein